MGYDAIIVILAVLCAVLIFALIRTKSQVKDGDSEIRMLNYKVNSKEKEIAEKQRVIDMKQQEITRFSEQLSIAKKERNKTKVALQDLYGSNIKALPFFAGIMADFLTVDYEKLADSLDWGRSEARAEKVAAIREIRRAAREQIAASKEAQYQLAYLITLFPGLQDIIEDEFSSLPVEIDDIPERDRVRDYVSAAEWRTLSETRRNQIALDRYIEGRHKSKWQVGRDYELYIGYMFEQRGYKVEYFGSLMGLEDLGRDLIVTSKEGKVLIVQCKYWSQRKLIHEKHIAQLFGTTICYRAENDLPERLVDGMLVTNTELSETARRFAQMLKIDYKEHVEIGDFPRIKCNIGRDGEFGFETKIYHLPFDQQYDATKICNKGEFMAMTVKEAEKAGFHRARKWFGA